MNWLKQNAPSIEALAALLTACVAVAALIGVKLQLDASAHQQAAQSARDIYRAQLALAVQYLQYAEPDVCNLLKSDEYPAYAAFVEQLLYTSEQVVTAQPEWSSGVFQQLKPHAIFFCASDEWVGYSEGAQSLINEIQNTNCPSAPPVDMCS